jgi:LPXTG-motif cell wall-anchored protein
MGSTAFAAGEGEGSEAPATPEYSITVNNENSAMSINGKTYNAYKLFDLKYNGDKYSYTISTDNKFYKTKDAKDVLDLYFDFTDIASDSTTKTVTVKTAKQDETSKTLTASDVRALADALQPYIAGAVAAGSATATAESVTIGLAEAGYYIVTGTVVPTDPNSKEEVVSAVILDNADKTATVKPKADVPTLDKKITNVTDNGSVLDDNGKAAVAKVGSTVTYELISNRPDLTGYSNYVFTFGDKITSGLDYVNNSFKLKVGNGEATSVVPELSQDKKSFIYTIPFNTLKTYEPGVAIILTYDCTVNSNALTTDYENNTANLTYSHSPYDEETNETPDKKTYVIDLNLDVDKVAENAEGEKLTGAEFKLYREVTTTTDPEEEDVDATTTTKKEYYKWVNDVVTWTNEENADVFETDNGKLKQQIRGLDVGEYFLVETKAPDGYNLLKDPVIVVINANANDVAAVETVTYTATYGGETAVMTNGTVNLATETQAQKQPVATGVIVNNSGTELPSTGGIGTTIFYVVGGIMVAGAVVFLLTKRRVAGNE